MFQPRASLTSVAAFLAVLGTQALSQTVTIQTVDGNISLTGTIRSFDGENYDFESLLGRMSIPTAAVICLGEACPVIDDGKLNAAVAVVDRPSKALLNGLVGAFAANNDLVATPNADGLDVSSFSVTDGEDEEPGELTVTEANQRDAFLSLLEGETQVVFSTVPVSNALADEFVAAGFPDLREPGREIVVALDAIVPSVHPSNTVRDLSSPTIGRIAAGRVSNWSELGGPDLPIRMIMPADDTSIATVFNERILRPNRLRLSRSIERVANEAEAAAIVAEDPSAITLTSAALSGGTKPLPIRESCGPLSIPTDFAIKAEEYPLARRVLMYTSGAELSQSVKELLAFAGSTEAQTQYIDAGFFGQTVETVPMTLQGTRLASAILQTDTAEGFEATRSLTQQLTLADRLSTTFRFEAGSTELDNKSRRDAVRVAEYLMRPENAQREVLLYGFTDSLGRNDLNQLLSLRQAVGISEAIVNASSGQISQDRIVVTSFGSIAPVGCNDTAEGRYSNRRVEVWLR
ncbi:MAG: phosphate ABC transporter substrate-binding/OmpA family protein [Pseudomonadota bacterium]